MSPNKTASVGDPTNNDKQANSNATTPFAQEPCPLPTPDRNNQTANETSKYFDIDYAIKTFQDSMEDKNAISLHHYLNGFKELMK